MRNSIEGLLRTDLGVTPDGLLVDTHELTVVAFPIVLCFKHRAGCAAHLFHLLGMVPAPAHSFCQIVRLPRSKVQTRATLLDNFFHPTHSRHEHGDTAGKSFHYDHAEHFVGFARQDQKPRLFNRCQGLAVWQVS